MHELNIQGAYLAEITKQLFADLESSKYQYAEYRVSIYGRYLAFLKKFSTHRSREEWDKLAAWFVDNNLFNDHVRWLIQIPRLYADFYDNKMVTSMGEMIDSIQKNFPKFTP